MIKKNFTKKNLSKKINSNIGFSKNFSLKLIDEFFELISSELISLNEIKISSFGTFKVINKKERIGRNPKTRISAKISARRVVKFKPSIQIKNKLNS